MADSSSSSCGDLLVRAEQWLDEITHPRYRGTFNGSAAIIRALVADLRALSQALHQSESLRVMHARMQGAADGYQKGWHAALQRLTEGDALEELRELVPVTGSAESAEEAAAAAGAELTAALTKITELESQLSEVSQALHQAKGGRTTHRNGRL